MFGDYLAEFNEPEAKHTVGCGVRIGLVFDFCNDF
jgi:hypothetical protein